MTAKCAFDMTGERIFLTGAARGMAQGSGGTLFNRGWLPPCRAVAGASGTDTILDGHGPQRGRKCAVRRGQSHEHGRRPELGIRWGV